MIFLQLDVVTETEDMEHLILPEAEVEHTEDLIGMVHVMTFKASRSSLMKFLNLLNFYSYLQLSLYNFDSPMQ